jgi:hypothetical protein
MFYICYMFPLAMTFLRAAKNAVPPRCSRCLEDFRVSPSRLGDRPCFQNSHDMGEHMFYICYMFPLAMTFLRAAKNAPDPFRPLEFN